MKKAILRVLLIIFGLNMFTSCYGMPPEDWAEPDPLPGELNQAKASARFDESSDLENSEETGLDYPDNNFDT